MIKNKNRGQRGFTLVEMIVSTAIMLVVMGAMLGLINPTHGMFQAQPEISDMQQRLRIAADAMYRDLFMAGAGGHFAEADSLGYYFASILPFRRGARADSPASFFADRISVLYVPPSPAETRLSADMTDPQIDIPVEAQRGCPAHDPLCGLRDNMMMAVFDASGAVDTFRITGIVDNPPALQHAGQVLSKPYGTGAFVSQIVTVTYWFPPPPPPPPPPHEIRWISDRSSTDREHRRLQLRLRRRPIAAGLAEAAHRRAWAMDVVRAETASPQRG